MEAHWKCHDYREGDETKILDLYQTVNGRTMSRAFWRWKFLDSPYGKSIIKLLFDGDKLIGHYAVLPMDMLVRGTPVKAGLSVNTMTHPDYRNRGIFVHLAKETYISCRKKGIKFVYGFPNQNIYMGRIEGLRWTGFGDIVVREKRLPGSKKQSSVPGNKLYSVSSFDERINSLWNMAGDADKIITIRSQDYLNWRFSGHPTVKYEKIIYEDKKQQLQGYIVLKIYRDEDGEIGHIVDLLCLNDEVVIQDLVHYGIIYFTAKKIKRISCWVPENSLYAKILDNEGFEKKAFNAFWGAMAIDKKSAITKLVENSDNWHLMLSDLDII
jgi:predicted acetyltransferase